MLNNTTRKCPACSVMLQPVTGSSAVCPKCFRQFSYQNTAFRSNTQSSTDPFADNKREVKAVLLFIGMISTLAVGMIPITVFLTVLFVRLCSEASAQNSKAPEGKIIPTCMYLNKRSDYIRVFRTARFDEMPLGIYGERALHQIERLEQKQQALVAMLGKEHPFIHNGDEAEVYILKNCKQVLYRLKYCDQSDPDLCRVHADFLEGRLADNEKILHDFENLVTQLDLDTPETKPCLDVLAATLHDVRTQDGALPDEIRYDYSSAMMQQRMSG